MSTVLKKYSLYFLILVYVSGAIGFVINPKFFIPFTPFTLILTSFVFLIYQPIKDKKFVLAFAAIALFGFVCEVIGIKTSFIFGNYYYGNALGYKFFGVPLTISLNWALLIIASFSISSKLLKNPLAQSILSAVITTAIDYLIEQLASQLDFWYFSSGIAGLRNYIAWFCISFLSSLFFSKILLNCNAKIAALIIALQLFFFSCLFLFQKL